jgi:hypothetical protein
MNLSQIRTQCWNEARVVATTDELRLWTTAEMNAYINRIYRWIARETKCIRDAVTPSLCLIDSSPVDYTTYAPGTMDYIWANTLNDPNDAQSGGKYWLYQKDVAPYIYTLDPVILDIDEMKWLDRQWKLVKVSVKKWQINPWWEQVVGMPTEFATDYSNNTFVLNFRSETADTLRLIVRRLPLVDLVNDDDVPEFRLHYHDYFRNGVLWLMYSKQDSEAFDMKKATDYYADFMKDIDEIKQQEDKLNERLRPNHSVDAFR